MKNILYKLSLLFVTISLEASLSDEKLVLVHSTPVMPRGSCLVAGSLGLIADLTQDAISQRIEKAAHAPQTRSTVPAPLIRQTLTWL